MCKEERERDKEAAGASERLEGAVDGGLPVAQEPSLNVASELQVLGRIDLGIFEKKYASIFHVFFFNPGNIGLHETELLKSQNCPYLEGKWYQKR